MEVIVVEVISTVITAGTVRSAMVEIMSRAEVMMKGVTGLMTANPQVAATRAAKRVAEMRKSLLVKTGGACSTPMMQISCPLGILQSLFLSPTTPIIPLTMVVTMAGGMSIMEALIMVGARTTQVVVDGIIMVDDFYGGHPRGHPRLLDDI